MKIAIIGASGFIGSEVVKLLHQNKKINIHDLIRDLRWVLPKDFIELE